MRAQRSASTRGVFIVPLVFCAACAGTPEQEGVTPTQAQMYDQFHRASEIHDALVRGDLERAASGAAWLTAHPPVEGLPTGSEGQIAEMRSWTDAVAQAPDLSQAAVAAAQMGRSCGDCHRRYEVRPGFLVGTAPPEGTGAKAQMARHVWAAERMWEGLLGPEDYAWTSGATALRDCWLSPGEITSDPEEKEGVRRMIREVYEVGMEAENAHDPAMRGELYGRFLTTCIDCHEMTSAMIR